MWQEYGIIPAVTIIVNISFPPQEINPYNRRVWTPSEETGVCQEDRQTSEAEGSLVVSSSLSVSLNSTWPRDDLQQTTVRW